MKIFWAACMVIATAMNGYGQEVIAPGIYRAPDVSKKHKLAPFVPVVGGSTGYFRTLEVYYVTTLVRFSHQDQNHDVEELVIVTNGSLRVTINDEEHVVNAGGVAVILPGDRHSIENADYNPVTYFIVTCGSRNPPDAATMDKAGASEVLTYDSLGAETPFGKVYTYRARPTIMNPLLQMERYALRPGGTQQIAGSGSQVMILVFEGDLTLQSQRATEALSAGDVMLLPAGEGYQIESGRSGEYLRIVLP